MKKTGLFLLVALGLNLARAADNNTNYSKLPDADSQLKALVESVTGGKATASKWFEGPSNMIGVLIANPDDPKSPEVVGWATPDKKYLFLGQLVDKHQRNLTSISAEYYKVLEPTISLSHANIETGPNAMFAGEMLKNNIMSILSFLSKQGNAVASGTGSRVMFVFIDPKCQHCHKIRETIEANSELTRDITIYYLPVYLQKTNLDQAAQILENGAANIAAINANPLGFAEPTEESRARVTMNNAILARIAEVADFKSFATPTIVVQQDGTANIYQGTLREENFPHFLQSIEEPDIVPIQDIVGEDTDRE